MKKSLVKLISVLSTILVTIGCANISEQNGFNDVRRFLEERTRKTIEWDMRLENDGSVGKPVLELLKKELTADDAVQITLLNNRRIQAVYEELGVAYADLVQAGLLHNPVFSGSIRWAGGSSPAIELAVVEDFLSVFYIPLRVRIAAADFELAKKRLSSAVLDIAWETRTAFLSFQADMQQLQINRGMQNIAEASCDVAVRLHKAGNITDLKLAREQAAYGEIKLDTASVELAVLESRERLSALMGLSGENAGWKAALMPDLPKEELNLADIENRAIKASLDLEIAEKSMIAAAQRCRGARIEKILEDTGIGADIQKEEGKWSAGPSLETSIPIFDWGQGKYMAAQSEFRRRWQGYNATAVEVRAAARAARSRITLARQRAEYYYKVVLPLRDKISAEALLEYNGMQTGPIQLLEAKRQEAETQRQTIEALRDYWIARATLEQILNGKIPKDFPLTGRR